MNCTYCGAALQPGARLCGACGKLLAPTTRPAPTPPTAASTADGSPGVVRSNVTAFDTADAPRYGPLLVEPPRPTVAGSYEHGWQQLKRFFPPLFLVGVVYAASQIVISLIDLLLEEQPVLRISFQVVTGLILSAPLGVGLAYAYLRAARGERPELGDLFAPYRRALLASIAATLLYALCVLVGLVLLVVPGIIMAIRLSFYPYLLVDEGHGPVAALQESWERTRGYGWTIFGTSLLAIPIAILGVIALVVGIIPAIMWVQLAQASLFVAISARAMPGDAALHRTP